MVGLAFVALALLGSPALSTTIEESCPDGAAVESLSIWHGHWLDRLGINCTDGSEHDLIPPGASGGEVTSGVCAGSGDAIGGVESIAWYEGAARSYLGDNKPVVYLDVTCLDGANTTFADGRVARYGERYATGIWRRSRTPIDDSWFDGIELAPHPEPAVFGSLTQSCSLSSVRCRRTFAASQVPRF